MPFSGTTRDWLVWKGVALALVFVVLILSRPESASAHANLADADPAPNSVLDSAPSKVTIWFTEPLEPSFSAIEVLNSEGGRVDNDDSAVDPSDPTVMQVSLQEDLPNGTYTVAWRTLSTVDGHTIRGTFFYSVGEPLSAQPSDLANEPVLHSPAEPFMRWAVLLGGLTVLGVLMLWLVVLRPPLASMSNTADLLARVRDRTDQIAIAGIGVALIGSVGHLLVQASSVHEVSLIETLGEPIRFVITETEWGRGWLQRTSLLIGALGPIWALLRLRRVPSQRRDTVLWISAFLVTALAMATLSTTSHGAATPGIELAATVTDYIHLLAAAFWVGGLFGLALILPVVFSHSPEGNVRQVILVVLPRFSLVAGLSVAALIVTGLYSAWAQVTVLPALTVPYGQTLIAKTALVGVLLVFGATNLLWLIPAIRADRKAASLLRRTVTAEAIVGVLVILAAAYLTSLEPARQVASRQGIGLPQNLTFQDTAEGATIDVDIEPGRLGPNMVTVTLADRQGDPIANASGVDIRLSYLDADLGEGVLPTGRAGEGEFLANDVPVNIAGAYQLEVTVRRPDTFDARTAFRFEVASAGRGSSSTIFPSADTGRLLFGVELAVLGFIFLAVGIPLGGWYSRRGLAVMTPGLVVFIIGAGVIFTAQFDESASSADRNPFAPNPESLATGDRVYTEACTSCHGVQGRGDGPASAGLDPPPANLIVHVPLHPDRILFEFISEGISGTAMVGLADRYTDEEIWHVINYIKTLE
ncbi:MAG: copper resistance protein CopC [Chloroflexota bacterium]|nr:copper resistance protein CopC [Chloroflexota bacterium]